MMKTKMITMGLLLTLVSITPQALAQDKLDKLFSETTPQERAEMQTANMQERLTLREEQRTVVYDINLKYAKKMETAYYAGGGKLQRLRNMKAVGQEKDREFKRVLDPGQYEVYEKHKEEMKENMRTAAKERRRSN